MAIEPLPGDRQTTHSLATALQRLHRSMGLARPDAVRVLESSWSSLVGARLAAVCRMESLQGGRLVISAEDPAVVEQLRWQVKDLAAAADRVCGGGAVDEVVVRVRRPDAPD